ncbi:hypothetical protein GALL_507040 [mine drainage metagenome]|uniref:Uncharacterized protein n=1 Tax=mine drainage metagenome TaxID=410659 RepID=A0A1J5PR09_9ZZZZ
MHHDQRRSGGEFDGEVAVAHRIQRVLAHIGEAQQLRDARPVDGEGGAGQRRGAQRQAVDAGAAVAQPLGIAREHFHIGQQVVAEAHWLRDLQMSEAGHDGVRVPCGQRHQGALQRVQLCNRLVDGVAQPKPDVGCDLVVAAAAGMQALASVADELSQPGFDVEVDVFEFEFPVEALRLDVLADLRHAAFDRCKIVAADDAALRQHGGVGQRAGDIEQRQPLVEIDRGGVALDEGADRLGKTRGPGLLLVFELIVHEEDSRERRISAPDREIVRLCCSLRVAHDRGGTAHEF